MNNTNNSLDILKIQSLLQPLDIIFRYKVDSELDLLIAECGLNYHNILINHVALYLGNNEVIEANKNGVVITSLQDFCQAKIYVKRLSNDYITNDEKNKIIAKSKTYLNAKYNHSYEENSENIYCSDLIIRSFSILGSRNPFKEQAITFKNIHTQKIDERWLPFYNNDISAIKEGDKGSHPVTIFTSDNLITVI